MPAAAAPKPDLDRSLRLLPWWWVLRWAWLGMLHDAHPPAAASSIMAAATQPSAHTGTPSATRIGWKVLNTTNARPCTAAEITTIQRSARILTTRCTVVP